MSRTARKSSSKESQTVFWMPRRSSGISEPLCQKDTPKAIREWLTLSPGDSPASRSVSRESKPERTTHGTSGLKPLRQFGLYDPGTASWRMCQDSLFQDILELSSKTYTKHGMMQDGSLWELTMSGLPIAEKGCGLWPSPTCMDIVDRKGMRPSRAATNRKTGYLSEMVKVNSPERPKYCNAGEGQLNPDWVCWLMGWPIGWESLEPMKKVLWLDWSVDPADMEKPESYPTPMSAKKGKNWKHDTRMGK